MENESWCIGVIAILKEGPSVVLQYLDHDIAVQGATLTEALEKLAHTLVAEEHLNNQLPAPAPKEYFDAAIDHCKKKGQ